MPTYTFVNMETEQIEEHKMRMSEYDQFVKDNPNLERVILESPAFSYSGAAGDFGSKKPDDTWKEVLQRIGEKNPGSPLDEAVNRKSIKRIKTEQVLDKHLKKQAEARKPK